MKNIKKIKTIYNSTLINFFYKNKDNKIIFIIFNKKNKEHLFLLLKKNIFFIFNKTNIFSIMKIYYNSIINQINYLSQDLCTGFFLELITKGIGYNVYKKKGHLIFDMRQSHYIVIKIPKKIIVKRLKARLSIFGYNKCYVHNFVKKLISLQKVDIYKGKGVIYRNQKIKLKEGKKR